MDRLRQAIVLQSTREESEQKIANMLLYPEEDPVDNREPIKFKVVASEDGLVVISQSNFVATYSNDGRVELHNPSLLFVDMAHVLQSGLEEIYKSTSEERKRYSNMRQIHDISESTVLEFTAYLFLTGYRLQTSKLQVASNDFLFNGDYSEMLKGQQERIQNVGLEDKSNDRLASFLIQKIDPQRNGLKGLLEEYL